MYDANLILLPLFGFLIGIFVSALGVGGGRIICTSFNSTFWYSTQTAVATSLASVLPTTIASGFSHYREGNVDVRTGLFLGFGGMIVTLIGVYIANLITLILLQKILGVSSYVGSNVNDCVKKT